MSNDTKTKPIHSTVHSGTSSDTSFPTRVRARAVRRRVMPSCVVSGNSLGCDECRRAKLRKRCGEKDIQIAPFGQFGNEIENVGDSFCFKFSFSERFIECS